MDDIFNLHIIDNFFDSATCNELIDELRGAPSAAATTYGRGDVGVVDTNVRKVERVQASPEIVRRVTDELIRVRQDVGNYFGVELSNCEDPQFLRYQVGDFFVAHQDGGTRLIQSAREQSRKISVIVFLNTQTTVPESDGHCGGSLVFTEWRPDRKNGRLELPAKAGTFVAFPSETTHEVVPVTHGVRYSIASWYG